MKTLNKEVRLCEQQRRQHQKEEERLAKLANMQLQNDIKSAKKSKEKLHQTTTIDEERFYLLIRGRCPSSGKSIWEAIATILLHWAIWLSHKNLNASCVGA